MENIFCDECEKNVKLDEEGYCNSCGKHADNMKPKIKQLPFTSENLRKFLEMNKMTGRLEHGEIRYWLHSFPTTNLTHPELDDVASRFREISKDCNFSTYLIEKSPSELTQEIYKLIVNMIKYDKENPKEIIL
jgi:hypothetical protein